MNDSLARVFDDRLACGSTELSELAREILSARRTSTTIETYRREWLRFVAWATKRDQIEYPVSSYLLGAYLTWLHSQQYGASTINKTITVMRLAHDERDSPVGDRVIREIVKGILRLDKRPKKKARPLTLAELTAICGTLTAIGDNNSARDRAIISVGWMAALRSSELVSLRWSDVVEVEPGVELYIRESKTNKTAEPEIIAVPLLPEAYQVICPVRNLRAIVPLDRHPDKLVFGVSQRTVQRVIDRAAKAARLEAHYSSHCLRRGFASFAAARGMTGLQIMRHGRWKSSATMEGYVERAELWSKNPISELFR